MDTKCTHPPEFSCTPLCLLPKGQCYHKSYRAFAEHKDYGFFFLLINWPDPADFVFFFQHNSFFPKEIIKRSAANSPLLLTEAQNLFQVLICQCCSRPPERERSKTLPDANTILSTVTGTETITTLLEGPINKGHWSTPAFFPLLPLHAKNVQPLFWTSHVETGPSRCWNTESLAPLVIKCVQH